MTERDDNDTLDAELKPYLDGSDGVSAAWRNASAEQPPVALDALILGAARAAVQQRTPATRGNSSIGSYRIAASFIVGVLVTSLYFSRQDVFDPGAKSVVAVPSSPRSSDLPLSEAAPAQAPQATRVAIEQNVTVAIGQLAAEAIPAPVLPAVVSSPLLPAGTGQQLGVSRTVAVADLSTVASIALAAAEVAPAQQEAAVPAPTAARSMAPAAPQAEPPDPVAPVVTDFAAARAELQEAGVTQLEELMVTGSRVARAGRAPGYRASQQEWLAYILSLSDQVSVLVDALGAETASLEEEIRLFSETYPDVDLEAAFESQAEQ